MFLMWLLGWDEDVLWQSPDLGRAVPSALMTEAVNICGQHLVGVIFLLIIVPA